jgi:hypothetical protein
VHVEQVDPRFERGQPVEQERDLDGVVEVAEEDHRGEPERAGDARVEERALVALGDLGVGALRHDAHVGAEVVDLEPRGEEAVGLRRELGHGLVVIDGGARLGDRAVLGAVRAHQRGPCGQGPPRGPSSWSG